MEVRPPRSPRPCCALCANSLDTECVGVNSADKEFIQGNHPQLVGFTRWVTSTELEELVRVRGGGVFYRSSG